jgi:phosphoserine phosphatase
MILRIGDPRAIGPVLAATLLACSTLTRTQSDPLPSWHDTAPKQAIVEFVENVTTPGSPDFVAPAERIATFDNDGTLWAEQPLYFQFLYVFDRIEQLASEHPEWEEKEPFASVLRGDQKAALAAGMKGLLEMVMVTHAGTSTEEFGQMVSEWLEGARHPTTGRRYTQMVYQPMLELLAYLRANGFKTYIISGGGIEFMRAWAEPVYGVPPEQVVGSSIKTRYEVRDGRPVLMRMPELSFFDDKDEKPVAINQHIGRRPIMAFGNSDGDFQMLEWTTAGEGARFGLLVHHTDDEREWAYDRESPIGRLDRGLDEGPRRGWVILDMAKDWKLVFPPDTR